MIVNTKCKICGEEIILDVRKEDYEKWKEGELVQVAFPYLSADERELFITGICGMCFDNLFKKDGE